MNKCSFRFVSENNCSNVHSLKHILSCRHFPDSGNNSDNVLESDGCLGNDLLTLTFENDVDFEH